MKILVFLHGTLIMHKSAVGKTREEIVEQVKVHAIKEFGGIDYLPDNLGELCKYEN